MASTSNAPGIGNFKHLETIVTLPPFERQGRSSNWLREG
jgi:hypothetical protein